MSVLGTLVPQRRYFPLSATIDTGTGTVAVVVVAVDPPGGVVRGRS
jgi:hypothetical protein